MAAILISVGNINFDNTWLAIGEESIYGTVYYRNEAQKIFGTGPSGLTMKRVDSSKVPAEAKTCFDSVIGGSLVANCPVGDWVTPN